MRYETIPVEQVPPEALEGFQLPDASAVVAAIDDAGRVVGIACAMMVLHVEPWWVAPEYRKHPTLLRRMWDKMREVLMGCGAKQAVSVVLHEKPETEHLAHFIGAQKLPGSVWMLNLGGN